MRIRGRLGRGLVHRVGGGEGAFRRLVARSLGQRLRWSCRGGAGDGRGRGEAMGEGGEARRMDDGDLKGGVLYMFGMYEHISAFYCCE